MGVHLVHFYRDKQDLATTTARYVVAALGKDGAVVITATEGHRAAIDAAVEVSGVDLAVARANGVYLTFDADDVLRQLIVDGRPDYNRLPLRSDAAAAVVDRRPLFAYGEVGSLLWQDGATDIALELETLCNEHLDERGDITMLCGYPQQPKAPSDARKLKDTRHLCLHHTHLTSLPFAA